MHGTTETVSSQIKRQGSNPERDRIYVLAAEAMKLEDKRQAAYRFASAIRAARKPPLADTALELLFFHLAEEIGKTDGGVQMCSESQRVNGTADHSASAEGAVQLDAEGHLARGGTHFPDPPPGFTRNDKGELRRIPNKPHVNAETAQLTHDNTTSIFSTYKLPNGMEIGKVKLGAVPTLLNQMNGAIYANRVAIKVLQFVKDHVQPAHWGVTVEEAIPAAELAKVISDAEETYRHAH